MGKLQKSTYFCGMNYEAVIGLEIHIQLNTQSKVFCGDALRFGDVPNSHTSPVGLGMPGSLPVLNVAAIEKAMVLGLALGCTINKYNEFVRKHYFYPDLPKGYQITQGAHPICLGGGLDSGAFGVEIHHIHLEEDAGKSLHDQHDFFSYIDLNRAGTPLLELVTEPCIKSAEEAHWFLSEIRRLVRWLGVSDGNLEAGSLRCDANVSVRVAGEKMLGNKVEIKNLNSLRSVKRAIEGEIVRQTALKNEDKTILQQTRGYDAKKNTTYALRDKEAAQDYRYFADPDLPPHCITQKEIDEVASKLPELPQIWQKRLVADFNLSEFDAALLTENIETATYYQQITAHTEQHKMAANWLLGSIKAHLNAQNIGILELGIDPKKIAALLNLVADGRISQGIATQKILAHLYQNPEADILEINGSLGSVETENVADLSVLIAEILASYPEKVAEYRKGKKGLMGLFVGELMKKTGGKADAKLATAGFVAGLK